MTVRVEGVSVRVEGVSVRVEGLTVRRGCDCERLHMPYLNSSQGRMFLYLFFFLFSGLAPSLRLYRFLCSCCCSCSNSSQNPALPKFSVATFIRSEILPWMWEEMTRVALTGCFSRTTLPEVSTIGACLKWSTRESRVLNFLPSPTSNWPFYKEEGKEEEGEEEKEEGEEEEEEERRGEEEGRRGRRGEEEGEEGREA